MNISKQQVEAIVNKIYDSKQKDADFEKARVKLLKDPKHRSLAKKCASALKSIPESLRKSLYLNKTEDDFLHQIIKSHLPKYKEVSRNDIRDKILIASIESQDIKELQKILKVKF